MGRDERGRRVSLHSPRVADPWTLLLDDLEADLDAGLHLDVGTWAEPEVDRPLPASLAERAETLLARIEGRRRELEVSQARMGAELDELMERRRSASTKASSTALASPRTATLDRLA